jgi:hypothetical protein
MGEEANIDQNAGGLIVQKEPQSAGSQWVAVEGIGKGSSRKCR